MNESSKIVLEAKQTRVFFLPPEKGAPVHDIVHLFIGERYNFA
jgi:hypothetical protein